MLKKKFLSTFILMMITSMLISSCMESPSSGRTKSSDNNLKKDLPNTGDSDGNNTINSNDSINNPSKVVEVQKVEIRHMVDPFDGTYRPKLTIPKNFTGQMYIAGLNVTSLRDELVYVRFRFGQNYEPITIPATIGRAPGITPATDIEVLMLDIDDMPFRNLRLGYDLFDYNDYDLDDDGIEDDDAKPEDNPRDIDLYCRGLNLIDDPSFSEGTSCNSAGSVCRYAYAKIVDSGLYDDEDPLVPGTSSGIFLASAPSKQQIAFNTDGLMENDSFETSLQKALPDNKLVSSFNTLLNLELADSGSTILSYGMTVATSGSISYRYMGPYRAISPSRWEISGDAIFSAIAPDKRPTGLFADYLGSKGADRGIQSFLFPRVGKLSLNQGVEYLGSTNPWDPKTIQKLTVAGTSKWMDGSNLRMAYYYAETNEGISSCNVSARIELIVKDKDSSEEVVKASTKDVKLQVIRESLTNYLGQEVLFANLKTCTNNNACGAQECCYNNRCWSKEIVTSCLGASTGLGNLGIGQSCKSDYECQSLCCDSSTGKCNVHNPSLDPPVYCNKSPGQSCVAKEFCRKENISQCYIVFNGTSLGGGAQCALRCYNVPTHSSCLNGFCIPPRQPPIPYFDPLNPDCSDAVDPSELPF